MKLGRVLGPIPNEGNEMAQAVLTSNGTVIPRRLLRKLLVSELHSESEKRKRQIFDDIIRKKLGDAITLLRNPCQLTISLTLMVLSQTPLISLLIMILLMLMVPNDFVIRWAPPFVSLRQELLGQIEPNYISVY